MPSVPRPPWPEVPDERIQLLGYVDDTVAMCRTENLVTRPGAGGSREPADEEIIDGEICEMISLLTMVHVDGTRAYDSEVQPGAMGGLGHLAFRDQAAARAAQPRRKVLLVNRWLYEESQFKLLGVRFDQMAQLFHVKHVVVPRG